MSLIWSNCCQDDPCKPDCVVLYRKDINYRGDFNRLFNPEENYQYNPVTDSPNDNDDLPDGIDRAYTFSNGKMNLHYTSSSDTFIQDGVIDNIGFYLPIDITWSQEDQEYREEYTITIGNLVIQGETTGTYTYNTGRCNFETSIYVGGNKVYYFASTLTEYFQGYGSIVSRVPQYIIRYNNRLYYFIEAPSLFAGNMTYEANSVYEGADSSGLTGTFQLDYSFISEVAIDEHTSSPAQTTLSFGADGSTPEQRGYPIIWRPDKWQNFQEFQTFSNLNTTSDQTTEDITEIYQNDRTEREGCLQPSTPGMVEKGVTFPKCFPQVAVKFYGFKSTSSDIVIPGRITNASVDGQHVPDPRYPTFNIANINAEAQVYYNSLTATSYKSVYWANGATVSFDYDGVEGIIFNAVSGDENTITFEPMNPVDVMTNIQAFYDQYNYDSSQTGYTEGGEFFNYAQNAILSEYDSSISSTFKNCRANPFETFEYKFREGGSYTYEAYPDYYGVHAGKTDNGFQLDNITLTVFKGVVAPTIHVSIAPLGKFNFVFENCEPYLAQEDIDDYNDDQWPREVELKRAGIVDTVYTTGSSIIGVTRTTAVLDTNFSDFTIDSSKRDNRPVTILQYADSAGNPSDKYFEYKVTDQYGAESTGTVYIHFDSSAPSEVTRFFESEASNFTGLDYDLVCKLTAEPSMYTGGPLASMMNNLIELYYVHDGKQLEVADLANTNTPIRYLPVSDTIVHNFPLNRDITYPKWISWGGIKQDTIYAEFVAPDNHTPAMNRYALYNEYTSSGTPQPLTVDHCVLSVSMHSGTYDDDNNSHIAWTPLPDVYGVHLNPDPITEVECTPIDSDPIYRGVGHFLVYTDTSTFEETWVDVPLGTGPLIPYSVSCIDICRITDNTVPVIKGIRVDAITIHYTNGSQETVLLSKWRDIADKSHLK